MHLLALVLAVLLPTLLFGVITAWQVGQAYRQAAAAHLRDTTRALALALDKEIEVHLAILTALAASPLLDVADLAAFDAQAREIGRAFGTWIVVTGPDLRQLVNTRLPVGAPLPISPPDGPAAQALGSGRPLVSDVFVAQSTKRPAVSVFVPVVRRGRVVKVIDMPLDPGSLARLLRGLGLGEGMLAALTDSRQVIVARLQDQDRFAGRPSPGWFAEAIVGRQRGLTRGPTLDGQEVVVAFERLSRANWTVAMTQPLSAYEQNAHRPLQLLWLGGAVLLAAAIAAALWLSGRLLRPVQALAHQAAALTGGHATASLPPSTIAELEALRVALVQAGLALRRRREAEAETAAAAREGERRLRAVLEQMPVGVTLAEVPSGRLLFHNARATAVLGHQPLEEGDPASCGALHPDGAPYRPEEYPLVRAVLHGETVDREEMRYRREAALTWLEVSAALIRDEAGAPDQAVCTFADIGERKLAEEQQRLLTAELSHRVKNTLAVVQSLMAQTLVRARSLPEFRNVFEGRLHALARAHDLLLQSRWRSIDLRVLARDEVAAFDGDGARVGITGPSLPLGPRQGLALGLILHELLTNAANHGALAGPAGRVEVAWSVTGGALRLCWREHGVRAAAPLCPEGFGMTLIRRSVAYDLGGNAECRFTAEGAAWCLVFPLPAGHEPAGGTDR
jgi:PAS domain S-box-containing protein